MSKRKPNLKPALLETTPTHSLPERLSAILQTCRCHGTAAEQNFVNAWLLPLLSLDHMPQEDEHGNIWVTTDIDSTTLFCCHTDTVHGKDATKQEIVFDSFTGDVFKTDGQPLGADDGAGIWLLLEMIDAAVPGTYVFFRGEERGGIGSSGASGTVPQAFERFARAVAFDRRGTGDVITHQGWSRCCSDDFAKALAAGLNVSGLAYEPDDSGVFTDTANLTELIGECTNVSVGYFNEHSGKELLSVPHLLALRDACLKLDWEALPSVRKPGEYEDSYASSFSWAKDYGRSKKAQPYDDIEVVDLLSMTPYEIDDLCYENPERASELLQALLGMACDKVMDDEQDWRDAA